jgi:hypothetical protein
MPRKKDTASELFKKRLEKEQNRFGHAFGIVSDSETLGSAHKASLKYENADWSDPETRSAAAHHALSINGQDSSLKKAFEAAGLDDRNPFHWRKLITYFADVHFGSNRKRSGRKTKWSDNKLCVLLHDFTQRKKYLSSITDEKLTDRSICESMKHKTRFEGRYSQYRTPTILRNLQRARNPKENRFLGNIVAATAEPIIAELRTRLSKKDTKLDSKWESLVRSTSRQAAINALANLPGGGFKGP